jgi:hypothetical protein
MIKPGDVLLIDTNAIIEALRVNCWKAIATLYKIETVAECVQELGTGSKANQKDVELVRETARVHNVTPMECIALNQSYDLSDLMDAGERDLVAHALLRSDAWFLCGPDKSTIRALHALGLLARAVSLEGVIQVARIPVKLAFKYNYTEHWLSDKSTEIRLQQLHKGN